MARTKQEGKERRMSGAALQVVLSLVALLLGALLTFVAEVDVRVLCYVFCALLIAAGVAAIVYFFMTGAYKRLDDYNFALGVMLLILGCCGIAKIGALEGSFQVCMGILTLIIGVIALQNTVQLKITDSALWICTLIFTALIIFGGITILVDFRVVWNLLQYWILILTGVLALNSLIMTAAVLRGNAKREQKAAEQPESAPEPPTEPAVPEPEQVIAVPEPPTEAAAQADPFADLWPEDPPKTEPPSDQ